MAYTNLAAIETEYHALWEKTAKLESLQGRGDKMFQSSLTHVIYTLRVKRIKLADQIARARTGSV